MHLPATPLLSLILLAIPTAAIIPPRFEPLLAALGKRQCAVPCGYENRYCCGSDSVCYTDAQTRAQCAASTAYAAITNGGTGTVYTTTFVQTDLHTVTSVYTVWNGPAQTSSYLAQSTAICTAGLQPCGAICCGAGQVCWASGNCRASSEVGTSTYSSPVRPTSATTITTNVVVTTTQPFQTPVGTAGGAYGVMPASSSGGLSGGAIAGIVIGVIAGVILLIAICFCCILKAGFDGILAIFGLGKNRRRERTEVIEERYSRYGSRAGTGVAASRREQHGGWFGGGRAPKRVEEKKHSEAKILGGTALGLGALWALLGLRRKQKENRRAPGSEVSYSTYTDSYTGTSASSASSDRRTRQSRASRPSRRP